MRAGPSKGATGGLGHFVLRLLNRVLVPLRPPARRVGRRVYVLRDRTGRTAVVEDLSAIWREAEQLAGRPLDPLDPDLLVRLA